MFVLKLSSIELKNVNPSHFTCFPSMGTEIACFLQPQNYNEDSSGLCDIFSGIYIYTQGLG